MYHISNRIFGLHSSPRYDWSVLIEIKIFIYQYLYIYFINKKIKQINNHYILRMCTLPYVYHINIKEYMCIGGYFEFGSDAQITNALLHRCNRHNIAI